MSSVNTKKAFTIIELLVVLAVMGVFAAIAYPNISSWITDREVKKEVYETVAFIKERKAEVTSGKYGMTQLHLKPNLDLKMTEFTDEILMNPYSIIQLNTTKEKQSIAIELETYLTSDIVMSKIENFTINNEQSFFVL